MTELEERLAAPGGAALRDELLESLAALQARLRLRIAAGLPRSSYEDVSAAADAAQAASEVLRDWPAAT